MTTRTLVAGGVLGLVVAVAATTPQAAQDRTSERAFASGGTVYLDLSAGEYTITPSSDDTIRVTARPTSKHDADETSVRIDVNTARQRAEVFVDGPLNDGVKVDIELPRRTHLVTELSAGELRLKGIEGSKDISARAGELNIEVGERDRYRHVDASVRIGELQASKFGVQKEGFFRSFEWNGRGSYDLRVKLWVGELTLN
jgi:hypothetical protein